MQFITIALMGFFAFSGTQSPEMPPSPAPTAEMIAESDHIALEDAGELDRASADEALTLTVKLTSYNAVPEQTDGNPHITASGAVSNPEVVAARSVDLAGDLPFGTVIALERTGKDTEGCRFGAVESLIGYRVIADSMHSRKRNQVDVLLDPTDTVLVHGVETNPSLALGLCNEVTIRVIGKIDLKDMPKTQDALARMVAGDTVAVR